jgi:biopolymer transport protein ExbD
MIPLIDVSLVLLIFFMMTSTVSSAIANIKVPQVANGVEISSQMKMIWIGINYVGDDQPPRYQVKLDLDEVKENNNDLNEEQVLKKVEEVLAKQGSVPEVRIAAHQKLSFDLIRNLAVELEKHKAAGKIHVIKVEVGEKK